MIISFIFIFLYCALNFLADIVIVIIFRLRKRNNTQIGESNNSSIIKNNWYVEREKIWIADTIY